MLVSKRISNLADMKGLCSYTVTPTCELLINNSVVYLDSVLRCDFATLHVIVKTAMEMKKGK